MLTDDAPRNIGRNRLILAMNLGGRFDLHIPRIEMAGPAIMHQEDARANGTWCASHRSVEELRLIQSRRQRTVRTHVKKTSASEVSRDDAGKIDLVGPFTEAVCNSTSVTSARPTFTTIRPRVDGNFGLESAWRYVGVYRDRLLPLVAGAGDDLVRL